jgi:hypothetical protein
VQPLQVRGCSTLLLEADQVQCLINVPGPLPLHAFEFMPWTSSSKRNQPRLTYKDDFMRCWCGGQAFSSVGVRNCQPTLGCKYCLPVPHVADCVQLYNQECTAAVLLCCKWHHRPALTDCQLTLLLHLQYNVLLKHGTGSAFRPLMQIAYF